MLIIDKQKRNRYKKYMKLCRYDGHHLSSITKIPLQYPGINPIFLHTSRRLL